MIKVSNAKMEIKKELGCIEMSERELIEMKETLNKLKEDMIRKQRELKEDIDHKQMTVAKERERLQNISNQIKFEYNNRRRRRFVNDCSCIHPLWYYLGTVKEGEKLQYSCVCFECLEQMVGLPGEFKNCLKVSEPSYFDQKKGDHSFLDMLKKYKILVEREAHICYASKAMMKRYNNR
jgi:hypothetical protein